MKRGINPPLYADFVYTEFPRLSVCAGFCVRLSVCANFCVRLSVCATFCLRLCVCAGDPKILYY